MAISTQFVCFLRTSKPVDFGSEDGQKTSMFFLLCAPDDRSHLYALARVARIIRNGALDLIKHASSKKELKQAINSIENKIDSSFA
jgi:mannitol/fructose-specific phosphotransferase system IIA component (Ntr-type)